MDKKMQQTMVDGIIENNRTFGRTDVSPEDVEQLVGFLARGDRLWVRQNSLEFRNGNGGFLDGGFSCGVIIGTPDPNDILTLINDKIDLINESRAVCMKRGILKDVDSEYNKLEIAYYKLKVEVESYIRLHQRSRAEAQIT